MILRLERNYSRTPTPQNVSITLSKVLNVVLQISPAINFGVHISFKYNTNMQSATAVGVFRLFG